MSSDIHIPDAARMFAKLDKTKKDLAQIISEIRNTMRDENISESELKERFIRAEGDEKAKKLLIDMSIAQADARNLIDQINSSQIKRGRKFRHFQLMLEQTMAKVQKDYGKHLQKHGLSTDSGELWSDIDE
jgi:hypothetical protein